MNLRRRLAFAVVALLAIGCGSSKPASFRPEIAPPGAVSVTWDGWSSAAFARAKSEKKLILVDVVAEWCHWCHVMDRTTYADPRVAALLDKDYVAIRVDSDARPDVAERYREWGWPATAILTPDAQPVLELRGFQEPDEFAELLAKTLADFRAGRPVVRRSGIEEPAPAADLAALREVAQKQLDGYYDASGEGWGRPQKYPVSAAVEQSFRAAFTRGEDARRARALATLAQELKLIDPVWGGMYQYSYRDWEHPHFEKIVAVQSGAISNFAEAYAVTGDRRWRDGAMAVKRYVRDFLTAADGGFFSSQDADFGAHGDAADWIDGHRYFDKDDAGRRAIGLPRIDTNVYADRNGLLIQALCGLFEATQDQGSLAMARKAALRVAKSHAGPVAGFTHGDAAATGLVPMLHLSDQVEMGRAFLALSQAGAEPSFVARAETVAQTLLDRFEDKTGGGFHAHTLVERDAGPFPERRKPFEENARAARFLLRLHHVTGEVAWKKSAERALRALGGASQIGDQGRSVGDYILAIDELTQAPAHVTVVGNAGTKETRALYAAALSVYAPGRIVKLSAPGDEYPDIGKSAVYVCTDRTCTSPVTDPARVKDEARAAIGK